jgi:hypothetical protein
MGVEQHLQADLTAKAEGIAGGGDLKGDERNRSAGKEIG